MSFYDESLGLFSLMLGRLHSAATNITGGSFASTWKSKRYLSASHPLNSLRLPVFVRHCSNINKKKEMESKPAVSVPDAPVVR